MAVLGDLKVLESAVLDVVYDQLPKPVEKKVEKVELSTDKLDFLQKVKGEELARTREAEKRSLVPFQERAMEEIATTAFVEKVASEFSAEDKKRILEKNIRGLKDVVSTSFEGDKVVVKLKQGMLELSVEDVVLEQVQENFDELKKVLFKE